MMSTRSDIDVAGHRRLAEQLKREALVSKTSSELGARASLPTRRGFSGRLLQALTNEPLKSWRLCPYETHTDPTVLLYWLPLYFPVFSLQPKSLDLLSRGSRIDANFIALQDVQFPLA